MAARAQGLGTLEHNTRKSEVIAYLHAIFQELTEKQNILMAAQRKEQQRHLPVAGISSPSADIVDKKRRPYEGA